MSLRVRRFAALVAAALVVVTISGCGGDPVPDIVGQRYESADYYLEQAGFRVGRVEYDANAEGPPGYIIRQSPRADTLATPGDDVDLVIAGALLVRVPMLIGKNAGEARDSLEEVQLRRGPVSEEYNDYVAEGMIISQEVSPGTRVPADTKIAYAVSLGPKDAPVPGVVGRWEEEARSFLITVGFPSRVDRESSSQPPGVVIGQWPDARTALDLGERVELVISRGPETAPVPDVRGMHLAEAIDELEAAGMRPTARILGGSQLAEDAIVASQEPVAGYRAQVGVSVVLFARESD